MVSFPTDQMIREDKGDNSNGNTSSDVIPIQTDHSEGTSSSSVCSAPDKGNDNGSNIRNAAVSACNSSNDSLRARIGSQLSTISDLINENLIIVRYATVSSIFLLSVYGVANTPLFYRYKSVMDIPKSMFTKRKWIHGRIVGVLEGKSINRNTGHRNHMINSNNGQSTIWEDSKLSTPDASTSSSKPSGLSSLFSSSLQQSLGKTPSNDGDKSQTMSKSKSTSSKSDEEIAQKSIIFLFRHSSPMERLLTQSAFDKLSSFMNTTSSASRLLYSSSNPHRNLLPIELAGIVAPPDETSLSSSSPSSWISLPETATSNHKLDLLHQLAQQKVRLSLQLLAHRATQKKSTSYHHHGSHDVGASNNTTNPIDDGIDDTAICQMYFRQPNQWFTKTNASLELVKRGEAWASSCGMVVPLSDVGFSPPSKPLVKSVQHGNFGRGEGHENDAIITNFNPTVKQLQNDAKFISQLEEAEYLAWKSKVGMWSSLATRELRREYVEEEEMLKNQWSVSGVWGTVKSGWNWLRRK